jgi:hypothetical protein
MRALPRLASYLVSQGLERTDTAHIATGDQPAEVLVASLQGGAFNSLQGVHTAPIRS